MSKTALSFANASCAHCAHLVTRILQSADGIRWVEVDQGCQRVLVDFDPTVISLESIQGLMEKSGYPSQLADADAPPPLRQLLTTRAA